MEEESEPNDTCQENEEGQEGSSDKGNQEEIDNKPDTSKEDVDSEKCVDVFAIKHKFSFVIGFQTWSKLNIRTNKRGDRFFSGNWTEVFSKEISKYNPACPLKFRWNHIRKENSRKGNSPFFSAKALCKFPGCVEYEMKIKKEPKAGKNVKIRMKTKNKQTTIHHIKEKKGRHIKGEERNEIAKDVRVKGPSNVFYERVGNTNTIAYESGNTTGYGSKEVLQKISSEAFLHSRLHKDVIAEIGLLQKVYEKEDESSGHLKGAIQSLSFSPFAVTVYSNDQLSIFADKIRNAQAVLYFDATGQVISNIPSQPKRVLYYSLVMKGQEKGDPPVPVAELISNSHNTVDITSFLMKLNRDLHLSHPSVGAPQRIEIDFTWSFIHAIALAFNHEDISLYLQRAWDVVHGNGIWTNFTKIHICSAHLLHAISGKLVKVVKNKDSRKYMLYVIARILDTNKLQAIDNHFRSLAFLLMSKHLGTHPELDQSIDHLDRVVSQNQDSTEDNQDNQDDETEDEASGVKARESAFATHFARIRDEVVTAIEKQPLQSDLKLNPHYSPGTLSYLLNNYFHILPLWTGLLLEDTNHDTNSPAENWMKIVKKDILGGKKRLTPSNFIIDMRANLKGRLREYQDHCNDKPVKQETSRKRKEKNSFSTSEEKWGAKKTKKGMFFSIPADVKPLKTTLLSKNTSKSFDGLHWGGQVQFGDRLLHLSNTCTVDNLLMILFYLLKKDCIRKWFEEHKLNVCQTLLDISSLFESGHWTEGRAIWLQKYIAIPEEATWNVWGGESEKFVQHFGEIQETEVSSSCSKRLCPRHERNFRSREILLGDVGGDSEQCSLQKSVEHWEQIPPSRCLAATPHGPCKGIRISTKRQFLMEDPPVLIMSVSYLSQSRGLTPTMLPDDICIQKKTYSLYGYTLCHSSHFKAFFLINKEWYRYDGLNRPEVTCSGIRGSNGQLEHVVYVLDDTYLA